MGAPVDGELEAWGGAQKFTSVVEMRKQGGVGRVVEQGKGGCGRSGAGRAGRGQGWSDR